MRLPPSCWPFAYLQPVRGSLDQQRARGRHNLAWRHVLCDAALAWLSVAVALAWIGVGCWRAGLASPALWGVLTLAIVFLGAGAMSMLMAWSVLCRIGDET